MGRPGHRLVAGFLVCISIFLSLRHSYHGGGVRVMTSGITSY